MSETMTDPKSLAIHVSNLPPDKIEMFMAHAVKCGLQRAQSNAEPRIVGVTDLDSRDRAFTQSVKWRDR